jgi:hypothetical protein
MPIFMLAFPSSLGARLDPSTQLEQLPLDIFVAASDVMHATDDGLPFSREGTQDERRAGAQVPDLDLRSV